MALDLPGAKGEGTFLHDVLQLTMIRVFPFTGDQDV